MIVNNIYYDPDTQELEIDKKTHTITIRPKFTPPSVRQCDEDDFALYYGARNTYTQVDDNVFKLWSTNTIEEMSTTNKFTEISIDDMFYIRLFKDNTIVYSTDYKEWNKVSVKQGYFRDGRFITLVEELYNIYKQI